MFVFTNIIYCKKNYYIVANSIKQFPKNWERKYMLRDLQYLSTYFKLQTLFFLCNLLRVVSSFIFSIGAACRKMFATWWQDLRSKLTIHYLHYKVSHYYTLK